MSIQKQIRWDVAWQTFDQVNKDLHNGFEINLMCLDQEEALAIAKQKIYDVAQGFRDDEMSKVKNDPQAKLSEKLRVIAILCSDDHFAWRSRQKIESQITEVIDARDFDERNVHSSSSRQTPLSEDTPHR